ncbi:sensor histidine kinase [Dyadobacter psychrotolerans]|uniref:Histidine kinase domain-containing protein n=1 Tax=Dyadobacter psychrotolerans TaxID=2541721 RepID=A0A4R5DQP4_9BACT|nr:histidine kinase [Dyadobacter psychrotolerans]TDE16599.1 hypothetical protein E0F88_10215 [Dyadobacter psychrotolerans]
MFLQTIPYPQLRLFFDGMLCMMALYALFSFTQHRRAIYWQYALYILCMIITFYWDDIDYGKANYLPGTNFKVVIVESLAFLLYIRFAVLLIEIPRLDPFSNRVLRIMTIIIAIEMVADLVLYLTDASNLIKSNNYIIFRCVIAFGALIVVPRILKLRQAAIGYFIAGSLFFVLGCLTALTINFIPAVFDRNPGNALTFPVTFMEFGVILEVLCFTLGMSVKNRKNELEKIDAQDQLIEQLLENEKKQSALMRIRDDISRDLHDELGADLSSISVMSYAAIRQMNGQESGATDTVNIIGETSRKVIARMREIIWSLHSAHDSVTNFSFRAKETAYALFEHQPIELHLDFPPEEVDSRIPAEYRRNLFLVYKEILHNIVRHSQAQNVYISLCIENDYLDLTMKDDGTGFVYRENKSSGNGLMNLKQRTSAFSGKFSLESEPGKGTIVNVKCPVTPGSDTI